MRYTNRTLMANEYAHLGTQYGPGLWNRIGLTARLDTYTTTATIQVIVPCAELTLAVSPIRFPKYR